MYKDCPVINLLPTCQDVVWEQTIQTQANSYMVLCVCVNIEHISYDSEQLIATTVCDGNC